MFDGVPLSAVISSCLVLLCFLLLLLLTADKLSTTVVYRTAINSC